eukprot:9260270-Alexandrium_andersonii.AAC.1
MRLSSGPAAFAGPGAASSRPIRADAARGSPKRCADRGARPIENAGLRGSSGSRCAARRCAATHPAMSPASEWRCWACVGGAEADLRRWRRRRFSPGRPCGER